MSAPLAPSRVAIILVNWNGWRDALECLSSVLASDAADLADVYVVDNDSSDGSVERIVAWCAAPAPAGAYPAFEGVRHVGGNPVACRTWSANGQPVPADAAARLTIVRSGGNLGFAGGNNAGIAAAGLHRYSHFWLLNSDTVIRHDALTHLLARATAGPGLGMVGSTLLHYAAPDRVQALGGGALDPRTLVTSHIGAEQGRDAIPAAPAAVRAVEARMRYVVGASMLVSAEFIRATGPMCEDYFLYFEEIDWALRGGSAFALGYAPHSIVHHKGGASTAKLQSRFAERLFYRNRVRFVGRFFPDRKWRALAHMALEGLRHLVRGRFMSAKLLFGALLGARALLRG
jgi:GT2 family glycosyltransferase